MSSTTGRKVLLAVLCWLTISYTTAKAVQTSTGVGVTDNISDESVSRLYREVPFGVYASANPYAAYSFQVPQFVVPKGNQVVPVKEESIVAQSTNGFLKDSYGKTFIESPQSFAYKATFPQQFVPLQNLPAHLSQPLVAAAPNNQYGHITPHFFGPAPFKLGNVQAFSTNPVHQFPQSFIYADNVRTLTAAPASGQQVNNLPVAQQQPSSNKNIYANTIASEQYNKFANEPKFQRLLEGPKQTFAASDQKEKQQQRIQKLPFINGQTHASITSVVNGKKAVANLVTKPPLPLLDLTLLEPLTFDNPLVPQVQHFLPRIHQVTYKKLPEVNQVKKHQMVFMVQNTKSYDSELLKDKPKNGSPTKKQKKRPSKQEADDDDDDDDDIDEGDRQAPGVITVQETLDEKPEISYEVNSPNYKESFSQKKVSFKKETESEPVNISYEKKTESEPVHYSYEKHTEKKPVTYSYAHNSKEPVQIQQAYYDNNDANPKHLIYHFKPETQVRKENEPRYHAQLEETSDETSNENEPEDISQKQQQKQTHHNARHELDEEVPANINDQAQQREEVSYHHSNKGPSDTRQEAPKTSAYKPEHRDVYYQNSKGPSENQESAKPIAHPPAQHFKPQFEAIVPEYEEDITILPTHKPHAPVQLEQHHNRNFNDRHESHSPQQNVESHYNYPESDYPANRNEQEKSNDAREETSGEKYTPNEKVNKQEESEEDFEKAYKDAAYGFPAYNAPYRDIEKEIYNPESYGASRYTYGFDAEKSPLRYYQAEGDEYPTQTRSQYKDARDKINEEYLLDYAVSRPKSLSDRYNKKADYYKMYEEHKPENYFANEDEDKKQQNAKLNVASSYAIHTHHIKPQQQKQELAKYRIVPKSESPHDNSAYATRPQHRYKSKTQFVEPQYQYGFEPLSIPRLLDSELAAMASNISPERKNLFNGRYYVKKTVTSRGGKDS